MSISSNDAREIREAYNAWKNAQSYFESVSEPDLIDYAVFQLEATKRRYMYMLNRQKELVASLNNTYDNSTIASAP